MLYGAGGAERFGPAVWRSPDFGKTQSIRAKGSLKKRVWSVAPGNGKINADIEPAGLFVR